MISIMPKGIPSGWNGKAGVFDPWFDKETAGIIYPKGNSKVRTFMKRQMSKARRRNNKNTIDNEYV